MKTYDSKSRPKGCISAKWEYPEIGETEPIHILRVAFDIKRQNGDFDFDERVKFVFEEWLGNGSVFLDVFFVNSDAPIEIDESNNIVATLHMKGRTWAYFQINAGPAQKGLPEPTSGASFHLGEPIEDASDQVTSLRNCTLIAYSAPELPGALHVVEVACENFSLNPG